MWPDNKQKNENDEPVIPLDDMPSNLRSLLLKLENFNESLTATNPRHAMSFEHAQAGGSGTNKTT